MATTIDNKTYRNIQEQVLANARDIQNIKELNDVLGKLGIIVVGKADTPQDLPDPQTYQGNYGDGYTVGTETPYDYYIFTRPFEGEQYPQWLNIGKFPAPSTVPGPQGETGPAGEQGTRGIGFTAGYGNPAITGDELKGDLYLDYSTGYIFEFIAGRYWQRQYSIMGPQGIQGPQGLQGATGPQGPKGDKGDTGDVGGFINIAGILASTSLLPDPSSLGNLTIAYLVGSASPYDLYIQVGPTSAVAVWQNTGPLNVATYVTANGQFQNVWDSDTKVDKYTGGVSEMRVYGVNAEREQAMLEAYSSNPYPWSLARRNGQGKSAFTNNALSVGGANIGDYALTEKQLRESITAEQMFQDGNIYSNQTAYVHGDEIGGPHTLRLFVSSYGDTDPTWQFSFIAGSDFSLEFGNGNSVQWAGGEPTWVQGNVYTVVCWVLSDSVIGLQPGGAVAGELIMAAVIG